MPHAQNDLKSAFSDLNVVLRGERHAVQWPKDQSLLTALEEAGIDAPFSCRAGKCGACVCTIHSGEVEMQNNEVLDDDDIAENYILGCQAIPITDKVEISFE